MLDIKAQWFYLFTISSYCCLIAAGNWWSTAWCVVVCDANGLVASVRLKRWSFHQRHWSSPILWLTDHLLHLLLRISMGWLKQRAYDQIKLGIMGCTKDSSSAAGWLRPAAEAARAVQSCGAVWTCNRQFWEETPGSLFELQNLFSWVSLRTSFPRNTFKEILSRPYYTQQTPQCPFIDADEVVSLARPSWSLTESAFFPVLSLV